MRSEASSGILFASESEMEEETGPVRPCASWERRKRIRRSSCDESVVEEEESKGCSEAVTLV